MDPYELLERFEALGDESDFAAARPMFERLVAEDPDARALLGYGYLLQGHGRIELRRAAELYERAMALAPADDKPHYQWISAMTGVGDADDAVDRYRARLAASPRDVRAHRHLTLALVAARDWTAAATVVADGLALAPDDRLLIEARGDVKAATNDPEGALADWARALELDASDIGPLFSSAFLLERQGRLSEAAEAWERIIAFEGEDAIQARWPRQMLEGIRQRMAGGR